MPGSRLESVGGRGRLRLRVVDLLIRQGGQVVEQGSHDQLIAEQGVYADMGARREPNPCSPDECHPHVPSCSASCRLFC